jgi:hypothetical protein
VSGRAASYGAAYPAAWSIPAGKHGAAAAPDPVYPTVTGTEEFKLEGDALSAYAEGGQVTSWVDDFNSHDFTNAGEAAIVANHNILDDESVVAFSGAQAEPLFVDRGAALTARSGITFFLVVKTGAISGLGAHCTVLQAARGDALSRMSLVLRRNDVNEKLAWWDESAGWLETSTVLSDNTAYIISYRSDNTSMKVAVNGGAEEAIGNPTHQQQELYNIGASNAGAEPMLGSVAAAIHYTTELSDADRQLVRDYLNSKYVIY